MSWRPRLSACATVPNLGPKPQAKAAETYATAQSFQAPQADWPADRWWDAYNDAQLSKLVDEALAGSPTLAQAEARLRAADATVEQSRASTLPTLDAKGSATQYEQSRAIGFPPQFAQFLPKGHVRPQDVEDLVLTMVRHLRTPASTPAATPVGLSA